MRYCTQLRVYLVSVLQATLHNNRVLVLTIASVVYSVLSNILISKVYTQHFQHKRCELTFWSSTTEQHICSPQNLGCAQKRTIGWVLYQLTELLNSVIHVTLIILWILFDLNDHQFSQFTFGSYNLFSERNVWKMSSELNNFLLHHCIDV